VAKEFKRISKKARDLLNKSEGLDVEFKQNHGGIKGATLVSFANSISGGTILVGIEEDTSPEGIQFGKVIGCNVTDNDKLIIQNKASDCIPPIKIDIYIENINKAPFFRIEVPPGKHKPYCTKSGEYKIREDGRDRALHPDELLAIFLSKEGEKFLSDFKRAIKSVEDGVNFMHANLMGEVDEMMDHFRSANFQISAQLDEAAGAVGDAHAESEDVNTNIQYLAGDVERLARLVVDCANGATNYDIEQKVELLEEKINVLLIHLGVER
jgi:predicted HTH transcriptional regulator